MPLNSDFFLSSYFINEGEEDVELTCFVTDLSIHFSLSFIYFEALQCNLKIYYRCMYI